MYKFTDNNYYESDMDRNDKNGSCSQSSRSDQLHDSGIQNEVLFSCRLLNSHIDQKYAAVIRDELKIVLDSIILMTTYYFNKGIRCLHHFSAASLVT